MGSFVLMDAMLLNLFTLLSGFMGWLDLAINFADGALLLGETPYFERLFATVVNVLQVALGLGFVIFVHELGHFLAAKTFGVRCDKFYVGFDVPISIGPIKLPRTLGKFRWGETEYGLGIIPLGGYVKMLGQDDDPRQAEAEAERVRLGEGEDAPLDPRSYPAKPVWQRMIIISAGVVMNLIFAVIMAGIAYWYGVPYQPTIAGATIAGGPAWEAGIKPGDQVLQFGSMTKEDPHLRYEDFAGGIAIEGLDNPEKKVTLTLLRGDERLQIETQPVAMSADDNFLRIGLVSQSTPVISDPPYAPQSYLDSKKPDLQASDVIVAVNGERLPTDERYGQVLGSTMTARFQELWREPIRVTVERPSKEDPQAAPQSVDIELPPVPVKTLGLGFAPGPITAIQRGSVAAEAGLKVGDIIDSVNDQAVENALMLPTMIASLFGEEVRLTVRRPSPATNSQLTAAGSENKEAAASDQVEPTYEQAAITFRNTAAPSFAPIASYAGRLPLGGIGAAIDVLPQIKSTSEGMQASGQILPGDELIQYQWLASDAEKKELSDRFRSLAFDEHKIDSANNVASLFDLLQEVPAGSQFKLFVRRDGKTREATVALDYAQNWYWHQRGVGIKPMQRIHKTDSLATAASLGFWETKRRFYEVLNFLRLLVTGKIGANGVGGPLLIAQVASSEASKGVSALLIFLTMLSANLAILNFLPIPALDGGHMVFLTAEAVRGKPVNEALQIRLTMAGVLGLLSLMAFVIVKDIWRAFS